MADGLAEIRRLAKSLDVEEGVEELIAGVELCRQDIDRLTRERDALRIRLAKAVGLLRDAQVSTSWGLLQRIGDFLAASEERG